MAELILTSGLFVEIILPFLLVFTVTFAVLQKTKVLGDDKKQINAIVGFVIGLLFVAFEYPRGIIVSLIPFFAVAVVILLIFMLLWGFVSAGKDGLEMSKGLKITFGILIGIALIIAVIVATGSWDYVTGLFNGNSSSNILANVIFIAIIIGAMALVLSWKESSS